MKDKATEIALTARANALLRRQGVLTPLILFMGFIGASLRYARELAFPTEGGFPFATLSINIFGCFVLELINQYVGRRMHLPAVLVKSLGVGLIGAFTTLSAFSTECLGFIRTGQIGLAGLYVGITIAVTFLASLAGHGACRALDSRRFKRINRRREEIHARHARTIQVNAETEKRAETVNRYLEEWQSGQSASIDDTEPENGDFAKGGRQ